MTQPIPPEDVTIGWQAGLAETPKGQKVAILITVLLGKEDAAQLAAAITKTAGQLSATRLVIPAAGSNGLPPPAP